MDQWPIFPEFKSTFRGTSYYSGVIISKWSSYTCREVLSSSGGYVFSEFESFEAFSTSSSTISSGEIISFV